MKVKDFLESFSKLNPESDVILEIHDLGTSITIRPEHLELKSDSIILHGSTVKVVIDPTDAITERIISTVLDNIRKGGVLRNEIQNII